MTKISKLVLYMCILTLIGAAYCAGGKVRIMDDDVGISPRSSSEPQTSIVNDSSIEYMVIPGSPISLEFIDQIISQDSTCTMITQHYLASGQITSTELLHAVQIAIEKQLKESQSKGLSDSVSRELYVYSSGNRYRQRPWEWMAKINVTCANDMIYTYKNAFSEPDSRAINYRVPIYKKGRSRLDIL